ncbi:MAG: hypothetical protein AAFX01_12575 [Cyanobacteria bacterium J06638_28]
MADPATTPDDVSVANGTQAPDAVTQENDRQQQVEYRLHSPRLPLAVYREVAAHLQQIDGVTTGLLPQTAKEFDYLQSQVGGLWIRYQDTAAEVCEPQVEAILTYYGDRYGNWETLKQ